MHKQLAQFGGAVLKKGAAVAAFDKAVMLASKPARRRAKKGKKPKNGDRLLSTVASLGRMALGAGPKSMHKPSRAQGVESFAHALTDPFSLEARGARVPDLYAFPTNTFRLQTSMLLGANLTEFGATFFPNPYVSYYDTGVGASGVLNVTSTGGMRRFAGATAFGGMTTPTLFSPLATAFRVVGGGIKIRNLLPELTATGRVYIACVPLSNGGVPNYNALETISPTTTNNYNELLARMGLPRTAAQRSASLQLLPQSKDFTVGQMVGDEELEIEFGVYHPDFFRFKPTAADSTTYGGTVSEADDVVITIATGVANVGASGNKEATQSDGGSAIVCWFEGFPSTVSAPIEIDICLHLECVPLVASTGTTSTAGLTPESDNPPRPAIGSTAMVEAEIQRQRSDPDSVIRLHRSSKGSGGARIADID